MSPVPLSITVAAAATLLALPPAVAVAWFLERTRAPGRGAVQTLVLLPLVLPPVVVGYVLLRLFSPRGPLGSALETVGVPVAFHRLGAVVAAAVVGFPLLVMMVALAMKSVDPRLEVASSTLGCSRWLTFWRVTLPLAWPGILAGAALCFARALGEFGATIVLAGRISGETETMSLAIYGLLESPGGEASAAALAAVSVAICVAAVIVARALDRRHRARLELER
jgi:molybdate transport system permease protein